MYVLITVGKTDRKICKISAVLPIYFPLEICYNINVRLRTTYSTTYKINNKINKFLEAYYEKHNN